MAYAGLLEPGAEAISREVLRTHTSLVLEMGSRTVTRPLALGLSAGISQPTVPGLAIP